MTDTTVPAGSENDDDELIPVETAPEPEDDKPKDEGAPEAGDDDDGDDDGEDSRLAQNEEDSDEEISANRKRRQKRREIQKRAREAQQQEIAFLRAQNEAVLKRLAAVEQHAVGSNVSAIDGRLAKAMQDAETAKRIIAAAVEAGNGADVTAAMEIRDAALREVEHLQSAKAQLEDARQKIGQQPHVDPVVADFAKEWMAANPWYDPQGRDADSKLTKQIDAQLAREGFHPGTRAYWEELTERVAEALNAGGEPASSPAPTQNSAPRRKAPPTVNTREHAPTTTRKEIYVTPERKQAMIEAGAWDDPVRRQRMLKAYQAYDAGSAR